MKDKAGRPSHKRDDNFYDLEKRRLHIPDNFITSRMIDPDALAVHDGSQTGRYGVHKYGRCLYGAAGPVGIYGYDSYGNAVYG